MENKKNSKGLIVLVIILIICVLGLAGYIVYDKVLNKQTINTNNNTSSTSKKIENTISNEPNKNNYINNNTTEDIIKNFNKRIDEVKTGKEDKTLLCNLKNENNQFDVDCTKITDFNIKKIDKVDSLENGDVYEIQFEVKCSSDNICFYNEQLDTENNLLKIKTYYLIKNNVIVESLGNGYFLGN